MWKRWSFKSLPASDASGVDKTPPAEADRTPTLKPSVKPDTVDEDTTGEIAPLEVVQTTTSVVQPSNDDRVVSDLPTDPTLVPQVVSGGAVKEVTPAVGSDVELPNELADGTLPDGSPPPHATSSAEKAPTNEESGSTPPTAVMPPIVGVSDDIVSSANSQSGGNIDNSPTPANILSVPQQDHQLPRARRLSFRSLAFFYGHDKQSPPIPSISSSSALKAKPAEPIRIKPNTSPKPKLSRSEKKALSSAVALRALIIGPSSLSSPSAKHTQNKLTSSSSPPDLKKIKSHLLKPKSANAVIAQLRRLPLPDGPTVHASGNASSESLVTHPDAGGTPIHAVCLACTDEEAEQLHFSRLRPSNSHNPSALTPSANALSPAAQSDLLSVGTASLESLIPVLRDLRLVSLLTSPDLGFGQPVSEEDTGPLTGSVPSAGTIANGFEEVTKQLMSLGFATSKAVFPAHTGIYPPEDRMSVLTYWWGLELVLPEPSVKYLGKVKSISHAVLNFLSAVSLFNNGVREVLPFIRYIANFVDFEWGAIQSQDRGRGVVCAATWVMPAAMVPRPWDFPSRPVSKPSPLPTDTIPTIPSATPAPNNDVGDDKAPLHSPPQESYPAMPPDMPYPPVPMSPMMPMLMVTPATLPRGASPPPQQEIPA